MRIAMIGTGYVGLSVRSLSCRFRPRGHLHRQECGQGRRPEERHHADLGAGSRGAGQGELRARAAELHDRSRRGRRWRRSRVHRGRNAARAERRPCRFDLRVRTPFANSRRSLKGPTVVVTKSTVPVGTGDQIAELLAKEGAPAGTSVASNPEFLREGAAIRDFKIPDRIVVGAEDEQGARSSARHLPSALPQPGADPVHRRRTAELIKYAANAFLAMKISFINEIANLCEAVDADVQDVARGIGLDNRIGPKFLHPGPGYGGSCFPKDTLALLSNRARRRVEQRIVKTVVEVNDHRKAAMAERIVKALGGSVAGQAHRRPRARLQAEHRRHARRGIDSASESLVKRRDHFGL